TPVTLTWIANTNCTVTFPSPQTLGGTQYVFSSASVNGGSGTATNPITVNSGVQGLTLDATFVASCTYSLAPTSRSFSAQGGLGSFTITTGPTCSWSLGFSADWITAFSPFASPGGGSPRGTGTRTVTYAVASNVGGARKGTVSADGQIHTV